MANTNNLENLVHARGIIPVALSQMVNPGLGPKCGWCGWAPPQDDVLGTLAYCTKEGLACPECRATEWNGAEEDFTANDVFSDAVRRGAGAVLAARYMMSWVRHRGMTLPAQQEVLTLMRQARLDEQRQAGEEARRMGEILGPKKEYFVHVRDVNEIFYFTPAKPYKFWAGLMEQVNLPARNPTVNGIPLYIVSISTSQEKYLGLDTFYLEWISNGGWWRYKVFACHLQNRWGGGTFREYNEKGPYISSTGGW